MRLSSRLGYGDGFLKVAERAVKLEEAGVEQFWVGEAYSFDAATRLGYLAARTRHAQLGAGIFPIYSRSPALLAQTAAGLDELSNGRAILGLGASGPQVVEGFHGVVYDRPLLRTREIMEICRIVWRREVLEYHGKAYTLPLPPDQGTGLAKALKLSTHPVRDRIPIYLATLAGRSVELTAELADGWLPIFYWPERADVIWGDALRRGYAKRDPSLGPLQIVAGGLLAIGDGLEHLRDHERPHLALYIGGMGARGKNFYNDLACQYGFEREAAEVQDLYLSGRKDEAAALIPQAMLDGLSLIGTEAFVRDRVEAHRVAGVTWLDVTPIGEDPYGDVRRVKEWIS
jgi:F420-dependent oxidoreductase-like protein